MAANPITMAKGNLGHMFVLWMNFVCGERRSTTDPEVAAPICLVVYLKPNAAEIQMSGGANLEAPLAPGIDDTPLQSRPNASPFWIMLLLSFGPRDRRMIAAAYCRLIPP
jgi:hypothetical protein